LIFFGANDSIINPDGHHPITIEEYKANLETIISHPTTKAQNPRILLLAPPPVNEYERIEVDKEKGHHHLRRSAGTTKKYAEACLQVAKSNGVVGVDIWSAFMKEAGWDGEAELPGSMDAPPNKILERLMYDGTLS
jgi:isoamyl acetate esterase